jgi:hypothetical protein
MLALKHDQYASAKQNDEIGGGRHGAAAAWGSNEDFIARNSAIFFCVVTCFAMFISPETPSKTIFGAFKNNPNEEGQKRCTSGYCLFRIR